MEKAHVLVCIMSSYYCKTGAETGELSEKKVDVMVCTCSAQGVALLEVWPCWGRCVTVGVGYKTIILAAWKPVFC